MSQDFSGRNVVVTGAGSGIGRATALRLSAAGANVALMGRRKAKLDEVAGELAGRAHVVAVDIADPEAQYAAFEEAAGALGRLHGLVANAAAGGPNFAGPEDRWDELIRTNVDGTYHSVRAFERNMAAGPEFRHVAVISSCLARFGVPGHTGYCASKAALLGLVRALALEWADHRVLVNAICPGWVETDMARAGWQGLAEGAGQTLEQARHDALQMVPLKRASEAEEIAETVAFLFGPGGASFTGQTLDPNNGAWMG